MTPSTKGCALVLFSLTQPQVQVLLDRCVRVRLYADGLGSEHQHNLQMEKQRFGTIALPFYVILNPDDRVVAEFPGLTLSRNSPIFCAEECLEDRAQER